jgi:hypothetical protein
VRAIASGANPDQLTILLEADNLDSDDEAVFEAYRKQRLAEMRIEEKKGRYGSMEPLGREDFVKEVTEGSKVPLEGEGDDEDEDDEEEAQTGAGVTGLAKGKGRLKGTGVVVFLFKDS